MIHPHRILDSIVFVELEDLHTEPGLFVDCELGLATTLLVGRCRLCGIVYIPTASFPHPDDSTLPASLTTLTPYTQMTLWRDPQ